MEERFDAITSQIAAVEQTMIAEFASFKKFMFQNFAKRVGVEPAEFESEYEASKKR